MAHDAIGARALETGDLVETASVERGEMPGTRKLDAHHSLQQLRRDLISRNANPQMVAERLLLGLRDVVAS